VAIEKQKAEKQIVPQKSSREIEDIRNSFEDVFGRSFLPAIWRRVPSEETIWAPAIDVVEKKDKFMVKVELPGVAEEDINVSVTGNTLTIEGEKETGAEINDKGYYYSETSYGNFSRSLTIPSTVDTSKIEASCDKGVLEIMLPKTPEAHPKKIAVARKKIEPATKKTVSKK
jgi:HSP20 family protein